MKLHVAVRDKNYYTEENIILMCLIKKVKSINTIIHSFKSFTILSFPLKHYQQFRVMVVVMIENLIQLYVSMYLMEI